MLHDGGEYERRGERHREGVGHNFIVPLEGVFADVELQRTVEVLEEDFAHVVRLLDDDGVFGLQVAQVGERGAEHRVGRNVPESRFLT